MESDTNVLDSHGSTNTAVIKIPVMIFMFLELLFFGTLPFRMKAFKENKFVLSISGAFSGGLFLGIGLIHLLPESNDNFEHYYKEKQGQSQNKDQSEEEHFPWAFFIATLSFAFILYIEKILTANWGEQSHYIHKNELDIDLEFLSDKQLDLNEKQQSYGSQNNNQIIEKFKFDQKQDNIQKQIIINSNSQLFQTQNKDKNVFLEIQDKIQDSKNLQIPLIQNMSYQNQESTQQNNFFKNKSHHIQDQKSQSDIQEEQIKNNVCTTRKSISSLSQIQDNQQNNVYYNKLTPYILQLAIGLHAIFEGIAIGIQQDSLGCFAISLAIIFHKWAEGLTLGIAYRKANIDYKTTFINIAIQACMNPTGIIIGWALSDQGFLIEGICTSISVGTFIYIATMEILVEEFNINRYRYQKYGAFLIAIIFVCTLFFIEQLTN